MKLLVITDYLRDDCENGSQVFARDLVRELRKRHEVDVLAKVSDHDLEPFKYGISRELYANPEKFSAYLHAIPDLESYDLVYNLGGLTFASLVVGHLESKWRRIPLVNHFQLLLSPYTRAARLGKDVEESFGGPQRQSAKMGTVNIFASHNELYAAADHGFELKSSRIAVIPNGLDLDCCAPQGENPLKVPDTFPGPAKIIVAAGRFDDYVKGVDLLFRAYARLSREHPDLYLVVIGGAGRFAYLLDQVPADRYRIMGWLPRFQMLEIMSHAAFAVVPSRYEPFGLVAVEAMAQGLPVVANDVGGLSEIVSHGKNGLLNPLDNGSLGLYLAMKKLATDAHLRSAMGHEAMRSARERYTIDKVADLICQQLERAKLGYKTLESV